MGRVLPQAELDVMLRRHPKVKAALVEALEGVREIAALIAVVDAYDTGRFVSAMVVLEQSFGGEYRLVDAEKYAAPIEGGTGLFGPRHDMIRASSGRPFVFYTRLPPPGVPGRQLAQVLGGDTRKIVTLAHRGMPAKHVFARAAEEYAAAHPGVEWRPFDPWRVAPS